MSPQLSLLPAEAPDLERRSLSLDSIDGFADATPSSKLRELIRDLGLLQPVVVVAKHSGLHELVDGRRRCKAIAQLAEAGRWPAPPQVDALVLGSPEAHRAEVQGGLALALHATRGPSPASELSAIEAILSADGADGETATVKEIAARTGMSIQTVHRRLRLRSLTPALRAAFDEGRITASVAEAAARLPDPQQDALADRLTDRGRLTLPDVSEVARQRSAVAKAELPGELFSKRGVPWQATVRGHVVAALAAIGAEQRDGQLPWLLERALREIEQS